MNSFLWFQSGSPPTNTACGPCLLPDRFEDWRVQRCSPTTAFGHAKGQRRQRMRHRGHVGLPKDRIRWALKKSWLVVEGPATPSKTGQSIGIIIPHGVKIKCCKPATRLPFPSSAETTAVLVPGPAGPSQWSKKRQALHFQHWLRVGKWWLPLLPAGESDSLRAASGGTGRR